MKYPKCYSICVCQQNQDSLNSSHHKRQKRLAELMIYYTTKVWVSVKDHERLSSGLVDYLLIAICFTSWFFFVTTNDELNIQVYGQISIQRLDIKQKVVKLNIQRNGTCSKYVHAIWSIFVFRSHIEFEAKQEMKPYYNIVHKAFQAAILRKFWQFFSRWSHPCEW